MSNAAQAVPMDAVDLFDNGFGPRLLAVTPPGGSISPHAKLKPGVMGKAPGLLTTSGWVEASVHDQRRRCHDYETAKLWRDSWSANVGFVTGDGYVVIDNDQGEEFSRALQQAFPGVPRRYVLHPKHKRDAFLFQVKDFFGNPIEPTGRSLQFRKGTMLAKVQILTHGLQAVISGTHRDTKSPYVWDREFDFDDIPVLSDKCYDEGIRKFIELLAAAGWAVPQAPPSATAGGAAAIAITSVPIATQLPEPAIVQKVLDAAADLLDRFPNRDVPPGETSTAIDLFLDQYDNWIKVAYCLAAELGRAIASLPQAEQLWCRWSDGRKQLRQSSRDVWRSVLNATNWQMGAIGLTKLVQDFAPAPKNFPPLDKTATAAIASAGKTPEWKKIKAEWGYLAKGNGAFVRMCDGEVLKKDGFSGLFADRVPELMAELGISRKRHPNLTAAGVYTKQPDKLILSDVTYAPGKPKLTPNIASNPPSYVFNRWEEPTIPAPGPVHLWLDHLSFIMESEADRFLKWCACVVQLPHEKPNWHFLVMGPSGLGKDTMMAPMRVAVGERNYAETRVYELEGDFNSVVESKLLVLSETSQNRHDARKLWHRLKQMLARPPWEIGINRKNIERYTIPNLAAMVMFSNEANPVYLERGDRRLHVVNRRHLKPKPSSYYANLYDWLLNRGGVNAVAAYLHNFSLSDADKREFVGGTAPSTPDKTALEDQNLDPAESVFEDLIYDAQQGLPPFDACLATNEQLVEQIDIRLKRRPSPQQVSAWLLDMEHRGQGVGRLRKDPKRPIRCGIVTQNGRSARLWHLSPKGPGGKDWKTFSNAELLALWEGKPMPSRATVLAFPPTSVTNMDEPI
jgi:Family of unknown function (DUF5906)/Bifunctional DNA primase/polymerase, N-terminal